MKKFEEEMKEWFGSPTGFNMEFQSGYEAYCALIKRFKDWVSPEAHQAEIEKIELQNLKYREEIARMQKALRKKNKAIKELNGAVKKTKARLKECEKLRIEANNEAASEYSRKCEVVEERAEFKREIEKLKSQLEKQQPEIPEFVADEIYFRRYVSSSSGIKPSDGLLLMEVFRDLNSSHGICRDGNNFKDGKFYHWMQSSENNKTFVEAILNGYTVAKEKKYLLKHKSLVIYGDEDEETDADELYLNAEGNFTIYPYDAKIFTQSEIDGMETGSYEKIEVTE